MGATQGIHWTNFVMAQVGAGMNGLAPQHGLPGDALRLYVAITSFAYERYIAKGGSFRGFERVADPSSKPFPEAVILRQTHAEARIEVPDHARDLYLGMSIGLEGDAARIRQARLHDISMVHTAHDGSTAGGFTIRLYETPRELS
jgi:hypothetical protein